MQRARKSIEKGLRRKGFRKEVAKKKHEYLWFFHDGNKVEGVFIYWSRGSGSKEIRNDLLGLMAKEAQLMTSQFLALVDCDMSEVQYTEILRARGFLG